ncbi:MAG: nitrilase family protein [Paludibacteraceae bacterium]
MLTMNISLIQTDIAWADKKANLLKTEENLSVLVRKTDLVVLPEMFTTGFCTDRIDFAETMEGETVKTLVRWARKFDFAIVGSFIARENGDIYNRAFFIFPDGRIETADKRHLFSIGGEDKTFKSGDKRLIVSYLGLKICVMVCYDIRFPVWSRNVNNEYDLLIYVANFPQARMDAWDALLKARAIENQSYVCGLNRVGKDGLNIDYSGHSVMLDFKGKEMLTFEDNKSGMQTINLPKDPLDSFRNKFAFWKDADDFRII